MGWVDLIYVKFNLCQITWPELHFLAAAFLETSIDIFFMLSWFNTVRSGIQRLLKPSTLSTVINEP